MFGKNVIMKRVHDPADLGMLSVHSIFYTLQGEGPFAGRPAIFVRLHGCSLACSWCDTEFELKRVDLTPLQLLERCLQLVPEHGHFPLIVITGGEPMRQNLYPFIRLLANRGIESQIETAGIHWDPRLVHYLVGVPMAHLTIVCSPKTPYVEEGVCNHAYFKYIISADELMSTEDGLPVHAVSQKGKPNTGRLARPYWLLAQPWRVFVQPLDPTGPPGRYDEGAIALAKKRNMERAAEIAMRHGYRLSLQTHKLVGLE